MVSTLSASDVPVSKVDALHILALHNDDLKTLSYGQKKAMRKIYALDDDRTVEQRVGSGDLTITSKDIIEFYEGDR